MTSRASWLNVSLIKENFKRFWPIMCGGLLFWLVCGPIALVLTKSSEGYSYSFMRSILRHINPAPILLNGILPVALALACFGYLHRTNSAGVMHSMPFTRRSLFLSNYVSGLVMAVLPVAVISLILLVMRGNVDIGWYVDEPVYFTGMNIFRFFLEEFTVIAFVYSIAVFAASISGLSVIHALTAVALNFICPVVYLLLMGYMDTYEYGFTAGSLIEDIAVRMNPWIAVLAEDGFSAKEIAVYLLVSLVIAIAAFLLYKARHLERAGESYVFRPAKYIIGFLMVFTASSLTGFVFQSSLGPFSYLLGFVVGYIVAQMIVNKTTKIFTKECLASGLVYLLLIAAIVCVFRFDLIGYQKRVPDTDRVGSVTISSDTFDMGLDGRGDLITEPENIERVTAFHKKIVADPANYQDSWNGYYTSSSLSWDSRDYEDPKTKPVSFNVSYALKNGRTLEREYWIPAAMLRGDAGMRDLWNSAENSGLYTRLLQEGAEGLSVWFEGNNMPKWLLEPEMENYDYGWRGFDDTMPTGATRLADKKALMNALIEDIKAYDYDRLFEDYSELPYISIHMDFSSRVKPGEQQEWESYFGGMGYTYYDYDDEGNPTFKHLILDVNANRNYVNVLKALLQMNFTDDLHRAVEAVQK